MNFIFLRKAMSGALLFFLCFSAVSQFSTNLEATNYLHEKFPVLKEQRVSVMANESGSEEIKSWQILSVDNNAEDDLIMNVLKQGQISPLLILNYQSENPKLVETWGYSVNTKSHYFSVIKNTGMKDLILYTEEIRSIGGSRILSEQTEIKKNRNEYRRDTLTYKFGGLIEYKPAVPESDKFRTFSIYNSGCMGSCPVFGLTILKNRKIRLKSEKHLNNLVGAYKSKLSRNKFQELSSLIAYIDFENLNKVYTIQGIDGETSMFSVDMGDSTCIEIKDNGHRGTHGLYLLYQKVLDIASTQEWKSAD